MAPSCVLGQIATVNDGFEEGYLDARLNGVNSAIIDILRVGDEDIVTSARRVRAWMASVDFNLPEGMGLNVITDSAVATQDRIGTVATKRLYRTFVCTINFGVVLTFQSGGVGGSRYPNRYRRRSRSFSLRWG